MTFLSILLSLLVRIRFSCVIVIRFVLDECSVTMFPMSVVIRLLCVFCLCAVFRYRRLLDCCSKTIRLTRDAIG